MRRIVLAAAVLVIFSTAGQSVNNQSQPVGATRIAVLNTKTIFEKWSKARRIKEEFDAAAEARKARVNQKSRKEPFANQNPAGSNKELEEFQRRLAEAQKRFEELKSRIRVEIGKEPEEYMLPLWIEMEQALRVYANDRGLPLIFAYDDPPLDQLDLFPNVYRKVQMADRGGTVTLFVAPSADISDDFVAFLNKQGDKK